MATVELARFSVRPEHEEALLDARPGMLEDFRADRAGFIDGMLVRLPDNDWLDIERSTPGRSCTAKWPLGRNLAEAEEMDALAAGRGLRTTVGLQARAAPAFRYLQDLIQDGYVGEVLSTSVLASGVNWGATFRPGGDYMLDRANGATMVTVPFAHTIDLLTMVLGEFTALTATIGSRRTEARNQETGEAKPMNAEDQVVLTGRMRTGAVASIHFRGGTSRGTNFLWEINGTDGDLVVTLDSPPIIQFARATMRGGRADEMTPTELAVPPAYERVPVFAGRKHEMALTSRTPTHSSTAI